MDETAPPTPPTEELLKKIQELEAGHAHLKQEMSKLMNSGEHTSNRKQHQRSNSVSPHRSAVASRRRGGGGGGVFEGGAAGAFKMGSASFRNSSPLRRETRPGDTNNSRMGSAGSGSGVSGPAAVQLTESQYLNILQSMGQSVYILDLSGHIIYWNRTAENLYGYSAAEALGQSPIDFLIDPEDFHVANSIMLRTVKGESWTGQFPVKNKSGERFLVIATNTPFLDENGTMIGIVCTSSDSRPLQEMRPVSNLSGPRRIASAKLGLDPQQRLQTAIASKISNLEQNQMICL